MAAEGVEALWVLKEDNRRYLSGFTGDSGQLLITGTDQYLLTDGRFTEQARAEASSFQVVDLGNNAWAQFQSVLAAAAVKNLHFEAEHLTYAAYEDFVEQMQGWPQPLKLFPARGLVEKLRLHKDETELALIQKAVDLADAGFDYLLTIIRPGLSERDIALELEYYLARQGSEGPSFATIIAAGPRAALPHGVASDRILQPGDLVVMDFGAIYGGYHSDLTRTIGLAPVAPQWRQMYDIVLEAQRLGIAAIQAGREGREVDAIVRNYICDAGYGEYFTHSLGHGVGRSW
jgi:Xaa-Pro aminopeptidase